MSRTPGQESTPSPLPWSAGDSLQLYDADAREVAFPLGDNPRNRAANAALIVHAVNSHAPMLRALRVAGTMLDYVLNGQTVPDSDDISAALFTVREAIRAGEMK
jgi:hypothetical protein